MKGRRIKIADRDLDEEKHDQVKIYSTTHDGWEQTDAERREIVIGVQVNKRASGRPPGNREETDLGDKGSRTASDEGKRSIKIGVRQHHDSAI